MSPPAMILLGLWFFVIFVASVWTIITNDLKAKYKISYWVTISSCLWLDVFIFCLQILPLPVFLFLVIPASVVMAVFGIKYTIV